MTNIEWTRGNDGALGKTWNPTVGCDKVSAGCSRCYAITTAYRLEHAFRQAPYEGLTRKLPDGSVNWTGKVRTLPERLALPLGWKKPTRVFVDSMSDLFHEDVPDVFIDQVFAVMAWAERHTFQVLTKRPERMREYLTHPERLTQIEGAMCGICSETTGAFLCDYGNDDCQLDTGRTLPLPNVWLGVSVEDQHAADERIPLLLQTPAAVRFLSCEPLLGRIDLSKWLSPPAYNPDDGGDSIRGEHRPSGGRIGRIGNRPDGTDLESGGPSSRPLERPNEDDGVQSAPRRTFSAAGLYAGTRNVQPEEDLRASPPPGLPAFFRADPRRDDRQSQERAEDGQQAGESVPGDPLGTGPALAASPETRQVEPERRAQRDGQTDGSTGRGDPSSSAGRRAAEFDSGGLRRGLPDRVQDCEGRPPIAWLIAGGESGPKHRPMDVDWARSLRDQCQAAGVAYFFKQHGGRTHAAGGRQLDGRTWDEFPEPTRELAHA